MQAILESRLYGSVSVNNKGEIVIPKKLREEFNIKSKDRLIVLAVPDEGFIILMPARDFDEFIKSLAASAAGGKIQSADLRLNNDC